MPRNLSGDDWGDDYDDLEPSSIEFMGGIRGDSSYCGDYWVVPESSDYDEVVYYEQEPLDPPSDEDSEIIDTPPERVSPRVEPNNQVVNTRKNRFWVGSPANSRMIWVYDALMPHENPNMVYLFSVHSGTMKEYEKSFAQERLRSLLDGSRDEAVRTYIAWHGKHSHLFLAEQAQLTEKKKSETVERHKRHLANLGLKYRGFQHAELTQHRVTHCYSCKRRLDSDMNIQCVSCSWLICTCGVCGCSYKVP